MKKIIAGLTAAGGLFTALPAFAAIRSQVETGFGYAARMGFGTEDLRTIIFSIVNVILGFLSIIAVLIILMGGFKWMTAGGNEEKVEEAKKLIIAGVVGLAVIFTSFAIATFVINQLMTATGAQ
jgi:hypothetical protein